MLCKVTIHLYRQYVYTEPATSSAVHVRNDLEDCYMYWYLCAQIVVKWTTITYRFVLRK